MYLFFPCWPGAGYKVVRWSAMASSFASASALLPRSSLGQDIEVEYGWRLSRGLRWSRVEAAPIESVDGLLSWSRAN